MKQKPPVNRNGRLSKGQRHMILLVANTVFFACMYFILNSLISPFVMPLVYTLGGGALAVWYVIYNRGFRSRHKTADMLPSALPLSERERMIAEDAARFEKTRWVLLVLLPILITILLDLIYVFLIPEGLLG